MGGHFLLQIPILEPHKRNITIFDFKFEKNLRFWKIIYFPEVPNQLEMSCDSASEVRLWPTHLGALGDLVFSLFGGGGFSVTKSCPTLATLWTVTCQAPLFMGFSRQKYWSRLPFSSPGDLPNPGIKPGSPALQADSLLTEL